MAACLLLVGGPIGCSNQVAISTASSDSTNWSIDIPSDLDDLVYDLGSPIKTIELPGRLNEISGLTILDDSLLLAVQDEVGRVYWISTNTGKVVRDAKFGGGGDYEGVEVVGDSVYVLESNGDLFLFVLDDDNWKTLRVKTSLSSSDDTEGLGYDPSSKSLLITQKEGKGDTRYVFRFSLESNALSAGTLLGLSTEDIEEFLEQKSPKGAHYKPAGIAINPIDDKVYIVSSSWRILIKTDRTGVLLGAWSLDDERIRQPEGIAFTKSGIMYISTEGAGRKARVFAFRPTSASPTAE